MLLTGEDRRERSRRRRRRRTGRPYNRTGEIVGVSELRRSASGLGAKLEI